MTDRYRPYEPVTASKLNRTNAAINSYDASGIGIEKSGTKFSLSQPDPNGVESMWVTLDEEHLVEFANDSSRKVYKYSWTEVVFDPASGYWFREENRKGDYRQDPVMQDDPSKKIDGWAKDAGSIKTGTFKKSVSAAQVYPVVRDPFSGALLFFSRRRSGGGVCPPCGTCMYYPTLLDFTFPVAPTYTGPAIPPITEVITPNPYGCDPSIQQYTSMLGNQYSGILYQKLKSQAITGKITGIPLKSGYIQTSVKSIAAEMAEFRPFNYAKSFHKPGSVCELYSDLTKSTEIQQATSFIGVTMSLGSCGFSVKLERNTSITYNTYWNGQNDPGTIYNNVLTPADWFFQLSPAKDYPVVKPSGNWTTGAAIDTFNSLSQTCFAKDEERTVNVGGYIWRFYGTQPWDKI